MILRDLTYPQLQSRLRILHQIKLFLLLQVQLSINQSHLELRVAPLNNLSIKKVNSLANNKKKFKIKRVLSILDHQ